MHAVTSQPSRRPASPARLKHHGAPIAAAAARRLDRAPMKLIVRFAGPISCARSTSAAFCASLGFRPRLISSYAWRTWRWRSSRVRPQVPAESSGALAPDNQPHASRGSRLTLLQACAHAPPISRLVLGQRVRRAQDESPLRGRCRVRVDSRRLRSIDRGRRRRRNGMAWQSIAGPRPSALASPIAAARRGEVARDADNLDAGSLAAAPCDARQYLAQLCSRHGVDGTFELNAHAAIDTTIGATTLSSLSVISEPNGRSGTARRSSSQREPTDVEPLFKWQPNRSLRSENTGARSSDSRWVMMTTSRQCGSHLLYGCCCPT